MTMDSGTLEVLSYLNAIRESVAQIAQAVERQTVAVEKYMDAAVRAHEAATDAHAQSLRSFTQSELAHAEALRANIALREARELEMIIMQELRDRDREGWGRLRKLKPSDEEQG